MKREVIPNNSDEVFDSRKLRGRGHGWFERSRGHYDWGMWHGRCW